MLFRVTKYMNAKNSMTTQDEKGKKKNVQDDTRPYERRMPPWMTNKGDDRRTKPSIG